MEATKFTAENLKVGQWICLEDLDGNHGRFVKVVEIDGNTVHLLNEDSMDRWGGKIEGDVEMDTLPIFGWAQA